ncbi:glycosyltransferase family 4 protein [Gracilimonas mengyeensis]|uniref:Glycosyltransferase involved in cell wall bisynthesis n=1 Tax=Gracilimonas mengyeensis TaxID=1302730 RepID=A0A521CID3_9BACT|nr:glycosyltransferase family 4 protein [Gracilimonas mengyeensis]SMO59207.1 Glycosyltransferase involved in cell wall bisynthesis [Gracilimonas mengyeensis]
MDKERIGFISTRFSGTDGVSLEAAKWAEVLEDEGHEVYWYAGRINRPKEKSFCVPEAHFEHAESQWLNEQIWGHTRRSQLVSNRIRSMSQYLKETLHEFVQLYDLSVVVIENAVTIPMNLPLGVAISEFLMETNIPAIAHHHDFYWERSRFMVNSVSDYLEMAFPPRDPELEHVVINKNASDDLAWRKGAQSTLVPNVIDFNAEPPGSDGYTASMKEELGFEPDDIIFLQPTRVVPRKGIEHAIRLVSMLQNPKIKLVITHDSGDEGFSYENMLRETAEREGVDLRFVSTKVGETRQRTPEGEKIYSLWDVYTCADLVTYPSLYEGFGNAFLEAIYLKKPLLVNRYDIFMRDIEPKGFKTITIDGFVTPKTVEQVQLLLQDEDKQREMTEHNFRLGQKYYSYEVLRDKLNHLLRSLTRR